MEISLQKRMVLRNRLVVPLVYLAAITAAEIVVVFKNPMIGIILHVLVLTALLAHGSLRFRQPGSKLLLGLTLAPLTRILSLAMPLRSFPQITWYPLIYATLFAAAMVVIWTLGLTRKEVGLRLTRVRFQALIALSAPVLGLVEFLILVPDPLVPPPFTLQRAWLPALSIAVSTGFVEELIFRGILQKLSQDTLGSWAWLYISLLFAVLHVGFLTIADVLFVFGVAVFFSWAAKKSGSLVGVSLAHGLANAFLYVIIPGLLTI